MSHIMDAPLAEAYAFRELMLDQHIGSNNFIVQTDCMQVVENMEKGGFSATASAAIYDMKIVAS